MLVIVPKCSVENPLSFELLPRGFPNVTSLYYYTRNGIKPFFFFESPVHVWFPTPYQWFRLSETMWAFVRGNTGKEACRQGRHSAGLHILQFYTTMKDIWTKLDDFLFYFFLKIRISTISIAMYLLILPEYRCLASSHMLQALGMKSCFRQNTAAIKIILRCYKCAMIASCPIILDQSNNLIF